MTTNTTERQPNSLTSAQIVKLTDAASELFRISYDLERGYKRAAKARLAVELARLDLFASECNHEDYQCRCLSS